MTSFSLDGRCIEKKLAFDAAYPPSSSAVVAVIVASALEWNRSERISMQPLSSESTVQQAAGSGASLACEDADTSDRCLGLAVFMKTSTPDYITTKLMAAAECSVFKCILGTRHSRLVSENNHRICVTQKSTHVMNHASALDAVAFVSQGQGMCAHTEGQRRQDVQHHLGYPLPMAHAQNLPVTGAAGSLD